MEILININKEISDTTKDIVEKMKKAGIES